MKKAFKKSTMFALLFICNGLFSSEKNGNQVKQHVDKLNKDNKSESSSSGALGQDWQIVERERNIELFNQAENNKSSSSGALGQDWQIVERNK